LGSEVHRSENVSECSTYEYRGRFTVGAARNLCFLRGNALSEVDQSSLEGFRSQNRRPLLDPLQQVLVAGDDHIGGVLPSKSDKVVILGVSSCRLRMCRVRNDAVDVRRTSTYSRARSMSIQRRRRGRSVRTSSTSPTSVGQITRSNSRRSLHAATIRCDGPRWIAADTKTLASRTTRSLTPLGGGCAPL